MIVFQDDGFYLPSFFLVQINNKAEKDRTLLHELIHFMQDISTTFGLINIAKTVDQINDLNYIVLTNGEKNSKTLGQKSSVHQTNMDLFSYYIGDGTNKLRTFNDTIKILKINETDGLLEEYPLTEIEIEIGNQWGSMNFHFGAMAIMESMAHEIECYIYGREEEMHRYPYDSVSMIVDYMYPELQGELVIAELCEAALMYYRPAESLLEILKIMKDKKFIHQNNGDTYNFFISTINILDDDDSMCPLEYYKLIVNFASSQLDDLMTTFPYSNEKLGRKYVTSASKIRRSSKSSITSLFYTSSRKKLTNFYRFTDTVGYPLILDNEGNALTHKNMTTYSSPFLFPAMYTVLKIWKSTSYSCQLYEYCNKNAEMNYDSRCIATPWERVKDQNLCPFAQVWKMWGLENIKVEQLLS